MLLKFIDRKQELKFLREKYNSSKAEFIVIYGRRRIGKTELIKQFTKSTRYFYFLAKEQNIKLEIERFREKFAEKFNIRLERTLDLEKLFREIVKKVSYDKKLVLVIDEFPYWISKHKSIVSEFQYLWDEILSNNNILLILTGSSVSIIEEEILSHKSPLFGRRTGQMEIKNIPINFLKDFLPNYDFKNILLIFSAVGAVPFYLKEFRDDLSFFENIKATFLNKYSILFEEAESLLRQELREVYTYFNILRAIQEGCCKLSEISDRTKVDITNINKYLSTLIRLNLLRKEHCITQTPKRKNFIYRIDDYYFNFWLQYVYPFKGEIEENPDSILRFIKSDYDRYMGPHFEKICEKFIKKSNSFNYTRFGKWWYKEEEIDLVALSDLTNNILFAECKWKENVDADKILKKLKEKAELVEWKRNNRKNHFAIFAKSFKNKKIEGVYLYDLKDMEKVLF